TQIRNLFVILISAMMILVVGCKDSPTSPGSIQSNTNQQAMLKAVEGDSAISSFDFNYDEESAMNILGKTAVAIYPLQVGQKMRVVSKNFTYTMVGDTAYGTYSRTFEGVLYISATYGSSSRKQDTIIQKPFTTVITRKVVLVNRQNNPLDTVNFDWKVLAVSLPEGGTLNSNVNITQMTITLPTGEILIINDLNDYYLALGQGRWKEVPHFRNGQKITIQLNVTSAYADTDFVTLTNGADMHGLHREKIKFDLVSSTPMGNIYAKVYQQTFVAHTWPGYFHAVINAFPKQVIYDDSTPVESNTWGIPYYVQR
ncbi:MAG: hypothetical protein M1480_01040, partial [Bacteroidetes bacterium]|nr:hypothetical protein [Bacteroidota bacterium]